MSHPVFNRVVTMAWECATAAEQIVTAQATAEWADWDRFSGRQRQRVPLGGFVGAMTYQGDLAPFHTLLALGTLVHIGKATVFGHGRYEIG